MRISEGGDTERGVVKEKERGGSWWDTERREGRTQREMWWRGWDRGGDGGLFKGEENCCNF